MSINYVIYNKHTLFFYISDISLILNIFVLKQLFVIMLISYTSSYVI